MLLKWYVPNLHLNEWFHINSIIFQRNESDGVSIYCSFGSWKIVANMKKEKRRDIRWYSTNCCNVKKE